MEGKSSYSGTDWRTGSGFASLRGAGAVRAAGAGVCLLCVRSAAGRARGALGNDGKSSLALTMDGATARAVARGAGWAGAGAWVDARAGKSEASGPIVRE